MTVGDGLCFVDDDDIVDGYDDYDGLMEYG